MVNETFILPAILLGLEMHGKALELLKNIIMINETILKMKQTIVFWADNSLKLRPICYFNHI